MKKHAPKRASYLLVLLGNQQLQYLHKVARQLCKHIVLGNIFTNLSYNLEIVYNLLNGKMMWLVSK